MYDQAHELRQLVALTRQEAPRTLRTITVASGKGGVGKTNMAVNLGIALAKLGRRVIVLDADLGMANINVILGLIPKYTLMHVLNGERSLDEVLIDVDEGIQIIAGASGFTHIADLDPENQARLVEAMTVFSDRDYLIIDAGAGIHHGVLDFIAASGEAIIVTTPEPTAITDAYGIIKAIAVYETDSDIKLLVNRTSSLMEGRKVASRITSIASQFLGVKVTPLGYVLEDPAVARAVYEQEPFMKAFPGSKVSQCMTHIAHVIENGEGNSKGGISKFFSTIFQRRKAIGGVGV